MTEPFGPEGLPLELARERILEQLQPLLQPETLDLLDLGLEIDKVHLACLLGLVHERRQRCPFTHHNPAPSGSP
jgi:hypothetical protein